MHESLAFTLFSALSSKEIARLSKFLHSPYFNHREDVCHLYQFFLVKSKNRNETWNAEAVWSALFPNSKYDRKQLNHLLNFFAERVEQFMAIEELQADGYQARLLRCRAFRRRGLLRHFDTNARQLADAHAAAPHRNAGWWLFEYQLQTEVFARQAMQRRGGGAGTGGVVEALANFFLLENMRWSATAQAQASLSRMAAAPPAPLSAEVLATAAATPESDNPAVALVYASVRALANPDDIEQFEQMKVLLRRHIGLFPPGEARDLYMAAINFAIRRHNRGERAFTRETFDLYREALDSGILLENGLLPQYTFINILNLGLLLGEQDWSRAFLEWGRELLPPAERDNTYRYGLAGYHFRQSEYEAVLSLLRAVDFSDVFVQLDARKMLLRSYFEMGEWSALASLLDSFEAFLRRQKALGYHRESYLNLVKFTQRLMQTIGKRTASRRRLAVRIEATEAVAERGWLLEKCVE